MSLFDNYTISIRQTLRFGIIISSNELRLLKDYTFSSFLIVPCGSEEENTVFPATKTSTPA